MVGGYSRLETTMGMMDIRIRLNIVRAGKMTSVYKSAKDRPMSLQDDMFIGKDRIG